MFELQLEDTVDSRNHPPPCDVSDAQSELTRIGGLNKFDQPNLRFTWGQSERAFARGRMRIKYPTRVKRETKVYIYGKPRLVGAIGAEIQQIPYGEWQKRREMKLPAFHRLWKHDVEWMGVPRWIVEQYMPPEFINDTPEAWERNRHTFHGERGPRWIPRVYESKMEMWKEDTCGPYPSEGWYEFRAYVKEDVGTLYGKYKAPDRETIDHVRRMVWERDNVKREDPYWRAVNAFKEEEERLEREEREMADAIYQDAKDWQYQYFGNLLPRVAMFNPPKTNKQTGLGKAL